VQLRRADLLSGVLDVDSGLKQLLLLPLLLLLLLLPLLQVQLWRADLLSGVLEVDSGLKVLRADEATGSMLGCRGGALQRKLLNRCVTLHVTMHVI
jgi:hypothetical protein